MHAMHEKKTQKRNKQNAYHVQKTQQTGASVAKKVREICSDKTDMMYFMRENVAWTDRDWGVDRI